MQVIKPVNFVERTTVLRHGSFSALYINMYINMSIYVIEIICQDDTDGVRPHAEGIFAVGAWRPWAKKVEGTHKCGLIKITASEIVCILLYVLISNGKLPE